jgi:Zn-dependent protease
MFITIREIIDIVIMTFAIGYIFSNFIKKQPEEGYDPLTYYKKNLWWENLKLGIIVAAPAIVLHELAHKFVAMGFGAEATLHAPINWYIIIIIMQLLRFPLLFFVGGYVSHTSLSYLASSMVSFAGPLTNLLLFLVFKGSIRFKIANRKYYRILESSAKLNLFLFGFNMIPIPGFDGYNLLMSLIKVFGF